MTNSGWLLSRSGALPDFNFLMAASSYSTVKSDDRLASAVAALESKVTLPVSFFMVCHVIRLECVESTDSTTSVHLALRTSSNFDLYGVFVEASWYALLRCHKHFAVRCVCGVRVISLWIWKTWCSSFSLCGE